MESNRKLSDEENKQLLQKVFKWLLDKEAITKVEYQKIIELNKNNNKRL